jgi:tight adherence protein B
MTIPLVVFATVLAVILGAYYTLVVRDEDREQRLLRKRVRAGGNRAEKHLGLIRDVERLSHVGPVAAVLARLQRVTKPVQTLIDQSAVKMTVGSFVLVTGCAALGGFLVAQVMVGRVMLSLAAAAALASLPYAALRRARASRMWKFEEQFPESIDLISRALKAGHTFQTGLSIVADEVQEPVRSEFRLLYERQNFGMPLPDALRAFADRVPVLDAKFFATAVLTQRDAGGNLAEVLDNLSAVIRERFKVKRQVRVLSAHGRITGWVLAGLPPVLAMAFMIVRPQHIQTLFNDTLGMQMIYAALVLQVVGTLIIRKIINIEY